MRYVEREETHIPLLIAPLEESVLRSDLETLDESKSEDVMSSVLEDVGCSWILIAGDSFSIRAHARSSFILSSGSLSTKRQSGIAHLIS